MTAFVTCYAKGTSIQTTRGDVAVEDLRPGDWVVTLIGVRPRVDYFHVELDSHDILLAEGRPAESYLDCGDRHSFENGGGILTLFAAIAGRKRGYAPLTLRGPEPDAVRAQLFARATSLTPGADSAAVATA